MGCCPSMETRISPDIIHRRISKGKFHGRTIDHNFRIEKVKRSEIKKNELDEIMLGNTISEHFLLYRLPRHERQKMIECLEIYECDEKAQIFKRGDPASLFFIIRSGKVAITKKPQEEEVNKKQQQIILERGNFFGDLALIFASFRSAGARAITACTFFCISHYDFRKFVQEIVKRNYEQSKILIEKIPLFRFLTKRQKNAVAYSTLLLKYGEGETIFSKGDDAHCLYIVKSGKVKLNIEGKSQMIMSAGESFGQNSLDKKQERSGSAITVEKTLLISLSRDSLKRCLGNQLREITFYNILKWSFSRDELFSQATKLQIQKLICVCEIRRYKTEEVICQVGKPCLFIVVVLEEKVNEEGVGSIFNTEYLFAESENDMKITNSLVKVGTGHVAIIEIEDVNNIFGKNMCELETKLPSKMLIMDINHRRNDYLEKLKLDSFTVRGKLGEGQLGNIYYVEEKHGKKYSMKCIQKNRVIENKAERFIEKEREILTLINSPFLTKLYKTYKDEHYVYFLTNFVDGVDFFDFLRQIGLCDKKKGQFFIGCLILALEHLHDKGIIYRDLKPENAIIDSSGFLHLIDLGIAKVLNEENGFRTFTIVGTPHYMAPEIFQVEGYTFSADIWSLGVVVYEMMCGSLPFGKEVEDPYEIFKQIHQRNLKFPDFYNDNDGKQLMARLLSKNPHERYLDEFAKIKNMNFFQGFNWNSLGKKSIHVPFKVKGKSCERQINEPLTKYLRKEKAKLGKEWKSLTYPSWDQNF